MTLTELRTSLKFWCNNAEKPSGILKIQTTIHDITIIQQCPLNKLGIERNFINLTKNLQNTYRKHDT